MARMEKNEAADFKNARKSQENNWTQMPARHDRKRNEVFHITQDNIYNVSVLETRKFLCTLIFFIRRDVYDHRAGE